jgi:hypothetical protein
VALRTFGLFGWGPVTAASPVPGRWTGAVTDHIVVGDRVALRASFHASRTGLRILVNSGTLLRACEVAYGEGIAALTELAGPAVGLTRLAGVCLEDLAETDDCIHAGLRWEAIGSDGTLFTALLADLMLVPAGDQGAALCLAGAYWPPPGSAGAGLGRAIVRCCATAVVGSFLDSVSAQIASDGGTDDGAEVKGNSQSHLDGEEGHDRADRAVAGFVGQDGGGPEEGDIDAYAGVADRGYQPAGEQPPPGYPPGQQAVQGPPPEGG